MKERIAFIVAVAATVVWIAVVALYFSQMSWAAVMALDPVRLAALLTAIAGPLVALWLVVVAMDQRGQAAAVLERFAELSAQERRTQQQGETLARAIAEIESRARRALTAEARSIAFQDLASNAAVLAERLGVVKRDAAGAAWARFAAGDVPVFIQAFLNYAGTHPDMAERIGEAAARDQTARTALAAFVRRFEQLADLAGEDKLVQAVVEEGALGRGYRLFKQADEIAARAASAAEGEEPADDGGHESLRARLDGISRRLDGAESEA